MKMRPSHKIGEPDSVLTIASALAMQPRSLPPLRRDVISVAQLCEVAPSTSQLSLCGHTFCLRRPEGRMQLSIRDKRGAGRLSNGLRTRSARRESFSK